MRTLTVEEAERRLLLRLVQDEWARLDKIRHNRWLAHDPIVNEQQAIEELVGKLK